MIFVVPVPADVYDLEFTWQSLTEYPVRESDQSEPSLPQVIATPSPLPAALPGHHRVRESIGRFVGAPSKHSNQGLCADHPRDVHHPLALHWECVRGGASRDQSGHRGQP